jgi:hypothetical protein
MLTDDDDKITSLLAVDKRLYAFLHKGKVHELNPPRDVGYLAYSDDGGVVWSIVGGSWKASPWKDHFRMGAFIQMGKGYQLNGDGYIYLLAVKEINVQPGVPLPNQPVYLARVGREEITLGDYSGWEYWVKDGVGTHHWSKSHLDASPVLGALGNSLSGGTITSGSAMFHAGIGNFLYFTGLIDAGPRDTAETLDNVLYESATPWGPWREAATFSKVGGYIAGLIAKDAGPNFVYFAYGGIPATQINYTLNIAQIVFETSCTTDSACDCETTCALDGVCRLPCPGIADHHVQSPEREPR